MKPSTVIAVCVLLVNSAQSKDLSNHEILRHLMQSADNNWHQKQPFDGNGDSADAQCCEPDTLQGTMHIYGRTEEFSPTQVNFYNDRRNCRLATISSSLLSSNSNQLRTIVSCSSPDAKCIVYTIDEASAECKCQTILNKTLDAFWKRCLPPNANYTGRLKLGADIVGQQSLPLQLWEFSSDLGRHRKLTTTLGCLSVMDIVSTNDSANKSGRLAIYYFDLDTKIRDIDVFKIPSYCHRAVARKSCLYSTP